MNAPEVYVRLEAIGRWVDHALAGECTLDEAHHAIGGLHHACIEFLRDGAA